MNSFRVIPRTAMEGRPGFYGLGSPFLFVGVADSVVSTTYNHISFTIPILRQSIEVSTGSKGDLYSALSNLTSLSSALTILGAM